MTMIQKRAARGQEETTIWCKLRHTAQSQVKIAAKTAWAERRILQTARELCALHGLQEDALPSYDPLPTPTSVRLLEVLPGKPGQMIHCQLHVVDLAGGPEFTAVSYSWEKNPSWANQVLSYAQASMKALGQGTEAGLQRPLLTRDENVHQAIAASEVHDASLKAIVCDAKTIKIKPNLYDCLLQLRKQSPGFYWIDALCINQKNIDERSSQVQMMGDIYSAADSVLVWLGSCPSLLSSGTERLEAFKGNLHGLLAAEYQSGPTASQKELDPALIALVTATYLITRRWFKRLWVLQEFCLARRLSFRFGEHRVDSETVTGIIASVSRWQFPKKFSGVNHWINMMVPHARFIPTLFETRLLNLDDRKLSVEEWLRLTHGRQTSDARDYVYAGLGIIRPSSLNIDTTIQLDACPVDAGHELRLWTHLRPTPGKGLFEVMLNLAACLLTQSKGLFLLSLGSCGANLELPSWLPDPQLAWEMPEPFAYGGSEFASWTTSLADPLISSDGRKLHIDAIRLGSVKSIIGPWAWEDSDKPRTIPLFESLIRIPSVYHKAGKRECGLEVLSRTLLMGRQSEADARLGLIHFLHDEYKRAHRLLEEHLSGAASGPKWRRGHQALVPHVRQAARRRWSKRQGTTDAAARLTRAYRRLRSMYPDQPWPALDATPDHGEEARKSKLAKAFAEKAAWDTVLLGLRTVFLTHEGYLGVGPKWLKPGDVIMLVKSGYVPYLFTPVRDYWREVVQDLETRLRGDHPRYAGDPGRSKQRKRQEKAGLETRLAEARRKMSAQAADELVLKGEVYVDGVMHGEAVNEESVMRRITVV